MKKFINLPENVVSEALEGFARAHSDLVVYQREPRFVRRRKLKEKGKVALISGGGSGHEPLHIGFVGEGMLDAACPGEIFTSPTPDQMAAAAREVERGGGVLFIVKNYAGDVMNFEMAAEMVEGEVEVATVLVTDDVAVEASTFSQGRRGVAGTVVVEKIVGAAAERGLDLKGCERLGHKVVERTGSMAVALSPCVVPTAGTPSFELGENEMEWGVGIHGEPGRKRMELLPADEIAHRLTQAILDDLTPDKKTPLLLMVNGLGGTPLIELYILYRAAAHFLEEKGFQIARSLVGEFCTSLEMAGASITLTLLDQELLELWDAPVRTPALRW